MHGKILTIAGSDPSGGAGIQADIKTISALGGYGMAAITALTVQNTCQVSAVHPVAAPVVKAQVEAVLQDMAPDALKLGMLATADNVAALAELFAGMAAIPLVVDPVILSTSGHELLDRRGVALLIAGIFPHVTLLTPNLAEAQRLTNGAEIATLADMRRAGEKLLAMGPKAVLVKGGHLAGDRLTDLLITNEGVTEFSSARIPTRHTHGTGCTLAAAIATGLGQGMAVPDAVGRAHRYVHKAILNAPGYGRGKGPLNHLVKLD